jgi:hypothetical protein
VIIWGGWGVLGIVPPLLGYLLGIWSSTAIQGMPNPSWGGLGIVAGAVGTYFVGVYLNVTKPQRDLAKQMDERYNQLHTQAESGSFYLGPGNPLPESREQAHSQADALLAAEYASFKGQVKNKHTLFFVPIQYVAIVIAIFGVLGVFRVF